MLAYNCVLNPFLIRESPILMGKTEQLAPSPVLRSFVTKEAPEPGICQQTQSAPSTQILRAGGQVGRKETPASLAILLPSLLSVVAITTRHPESLEVS